MTTLAPKERGRPDWTRMSEQIVQPNSVPLSVIYCFKMLKPHIFSKRLCCTGFPIFTEPSLLQLCTLFKARQTQTICHCRALIDGSEMPGKERYAQQKNHESYEVLKQNIITDFTSGTDIK